LTAARETASFLDGLFSLSGKVAVVTGATGVLGGAMARGLSRAGGRVGVLGRREERAKEVAAKLSRGGGEAMALPADVLDRGQLEKARDAALERWGRVDVLVNAAGGNVAGATVGEGETFFGLPREAFGEVFDPNLLGTVLPTQVFGEAMVRGAEPGEAEGSVVNVSSMAHSDRSLGWWATLVREALAARNLADKHVLIIVPDGTSTAPSRKCSTRRFPDRLPSGTSSSRREPTGPRLASILTVSSA
jgi:NAD(P)-dependent dehydrogenase (short-subunit alcohol dehydrogenase family)